ncbi:hypothetical protein [Oricola indica]|uniref:hypothetical protein n=1 Tax=Oricola indica TaxID=2872591 RepID=UPI003CCC4666
MRAASQIDDEPRRSHFGIIFKELFLSLGSSAERHDQPVFISRKSAFRGIKNASEDYEIHVTGEKGESPTLIQARRRTTSAESGKEKPRTAMRPGASFRL